MAHCFIINFSLMQKITLNNVRNRRVLVCVCTRATGLLPNELLTDLFTYNIKGTEKAPEVLNSIRFSSILDIFYRSLFYSKCQLLLLF